MHIDVRDQTFDAWGEIAICEQRLREKRKGAYGACATFVGTMRDFNEGADVSGMFLEHYPEMTGRYLQRLATDAVQRWSLIDIAIIHRVGAIQPGDAIVVIAVWSEHRGNALDACNFLIEELKARAPFWKRERVDDGERWVEHNTARD